LGLYQNASVFLNTSSWRACPLPLLEAMSVGCPVVTTSSASLDEIVQHEENGLIADDAKTMTEQINRIIVDLDLAKKLGNNARKTIIEKFNQKQFIDNWNNIFSNVVDTPSCMLTEEIK